MDNKEIEDFDKEWQEMAAIKSQKPGDEPEPEYIAKMTKGPDIFISERDVGLLKRKARRGFMNPMHRVYGTKSESKHPDQLINFNKLVSVKRVGDYDKEIKEWKKLRDRCSVVVETGPNIMLTEDDFIRLNKRSDKFDITRIIELSGSIDGTVLLNLSHVVHAYRRIYERLMSKEMFAISKG